MGVEPTYNGFADRRLTTWLRRLTSLKSYRAYRSSGKPFCFAHCYPLVGVTPGHAYSQRFCLYDARVSRQRLGNKLGNTRL